MKYNQPYGISDPNAPYINGDPSVGRAGSIPPAASIEYPQREIVNLINDVALEHLVADNGDLRQLGKAIQSGQLNYEIDTGLSNFYTCNLSPNPGVYFGGLTVVLKVANSNTGPAVLSVNGIGNAPIVRTDGSDVLPDDILAGALSCFVYDEERAAWQIVWFGRVGAGPPGEPGEPGENGGGGVVYLSGPRHIYVNDATGNDTLYDGTTAVLEAGTNHGPFKTCQRACDECRKFNLNGYYITVHVAAGTYAPFHSWNINGSGYISWIGDIINNPPNVHITGAGIVGNFGVGDSIFDGFRISSTGPDVNGVPGWGLGGGGPLFLGKIWFDACPGGHLVSSEPGWVGINGPITIAGSAAYFVGVDGGRFHLNSAFPPALTIVGAPNFSSAFYLCYNLGVCTAQWGTITNKAAVTGKRYHVEGNGVIYVVGAGETHLPGNIAGTKTNGGQYY